MQAVSWDRHLVVAESAAMTRIGALIEGVGFGVTMAALVVFFSVFPG